MTKDHLFRHPFSSQASLLFSVNRIQLNDLSLEYGGKSFEIGQFQELIDHCFNIVGLFLCLFTCKILHFDADWVFYCNIY